MIDMLFVFAEGFFPVGKSALAEIRDGECLSRSRTFALRRGCQVAIAFHLAQIAVETCRIQVLFNISVIFKALHEQESVARLLGKLDQDAWLDQFIQIEALA